MAVTKFSRSKKASAWSRENTTISITSPGTALQTFGTNIVPATTVQGKRTVGRFTITLTSDNYENNSASGCYWALVYVPQGQTTATLNIQDGGSLYEPNQYVIGCGYADSEAGPIRIYSRYMRKLNSGDFVSLLMASSQPLNQYRGTVSYSVKYN